MDLELTGYRVNIQASWLNKFRTHAGTEHKFETHGGTYKSLNTFKHRIKCYKNVASAQRKRIIFKTCKHMQYVSKPCTDQNEL